MISWRSNDVLSILINYAIYAKTEFSYWPIMWNIRCTVHGLCGPGQCYVIYLLIDILAAAEHGAIDVIIIHCRPSVGFYVVVDLRLLAAGPAAAATRSYCR